LSAVCSSFTDKLPLSDSQVADEFLSATVMDRRRGPALANLRTFYQLLVEQLASGTLHPPFELKDPLSLTYVKGQLDRLSKTQ
jgi:hypothetical protein